MECVNQLGCRLGDKVLLRRGVATISRQSTPLLSKLALTQEISCEVVQYTTGVALHPFIGGDREHPVTLGPQGQGLEARAACRGSVSPSAFAFATESRHSVPCQMRASLLTAQCGARVLRTKRRLPQTSLTASAPGVNYQYRSGIPFARQVLFSGGRTIPSITLNVEPIGTRRLPDIQLVDFRFERSFHAIGGQRIVARLNVYNALNASTVTSLTMRSGAAFLVPTAILPARIVEFGASYNF